MPAWLAGIPGNTRARATSSSSPSKPLPRKFYDLDRADLPAFRRMSQHAIVALRHQTTAPMTNLALFSVW
jgi:hypothetical protein